MKLDMVSNNHWIRPMTEQTEFDTNRELDPDKMNPDAHCCISAMRVDQTSGNLPDGSRPILEMTEGVATGCTDKLAIVSDKRKIESIDITEDELFVLCKKLREFDFLPLENRISFGESGFFRKFTRNDGATIITFQLNESGGMYDTTHECLRTFVSGLAAFYAGEF